MKNLLSTIFITCFIILFINVNAEDNEDNIDTHWMEFVDRTKKLNEINIPGTHDSGTFDIARITTNRFVDYFISPGFALHGTVLADFTETQNLDIREQLDHGIRYLDLRMASDSYYGKNIYISHGPIPVINRYKGNYDYLLVTDVLEECVNFLISHPTETIILHFKKENFLEGVEDSVIGSILADYTVRNETKVPNTNGKLYKDFYYTESSIPTLDKAKGRIVILTRSSYLDVGIRVDIKDMGSFREYPKDGNKCYPLIYDNYRIQDAYNLDADEKWDLVYDILTNKIAKVDDTNNRFYSPPDNTPLTFNFMNMARMDTKHDSMDDIIKDIGDLFFDADIDDSAYYVNVRLAKFISEKKDSIHNNWFILDYPTKDVIREIYQSNSGNESLRKEEIKVPGSGAIFWSGAKYWITQIPIIGTAFDIVFKRSENTSKIYPCLQRKIDKSGHDIVKTDYRCVHNKLNQWYIESNNKYFNIVSVYDNKCLTYINDNLEINECDKKNINNDFIINNKAICSRVDENKCLDSNFNIMPIPLESKIYENLTCSIKFAKHGYRCCSNQNTQVKYVDNLGNWGVENGKLCGIGYTRCSWNIFEYPCCSSVNPEVKEEDDKGLYGIEDGEWCGIGEPVYDTKIRIRNKKTQECLITNLYSDTNILLMGDCNHSKWTYL